MSTTGHENEVINVGGLKASLQKFKTDIVDEGLSDKQDTISDLSDIRSGASKGETSYQKPSGGIPNSDLATAVQTSLGKADTALQSHQDISGKVDKTTTVNGHALNGNVTVSKSDVGLGNVTNDSQVKRSEMGVASGVATLDSAGKVPASQLPSYVDDVLEYDTKSAFPTTGEAGKIYVDKSTNTSWRWSGTTYVQIKGDLVIGTTTGTAADGGVANTHYNNTSNPHSVTKAQVGLGSVVNTGDSATPVSGGTTKFTTGGAYTELNKKVDKVSGKGLSTNDYTTDEKNKLAGIAAGAEVNVQSDWNATSGDAFIKNKPTIPDSFQWFGTSSTAAATVQKEVSIPSITSLKTGQIIVVQPTVTSTVADSTLKLNSFDAYPMRYNNAAITISTDSIVWAANIPSLFVFDGTYWIFLGHGLDINTTYSAMSVAEGTAGTATSARTMRADHLKQIIQALAPQSDWNATSGDAVILNKPTSLPASDVSAWAKASTKPSYSLDEVSDGSTRKLANYLPLSGGTLTGNIIFNRSVTEHTGYNRTELLVYSKDPNAVSQILYRYRLMYYPDNGRMVRDFLVSNMCSFSTTDAEAGFEGVSDLILGNTSLLSAANNKYGRIRLYGRRDADTTTVRTAYIYPTVLTANRNYVLPDQGGTFAMTSDIPTKVSQLTNDSGYIKSNADITGNAGSATKLQTSRTIWGQSFDGSANVSGAISGATTISASSNVSVGGKLSVTGDATLTSINGVTVGSSPKFTDTNTNVTQTATSTSADYEVLFSATADNTTRTEAARKNSNLKFNPSTGNLQATKLNGVAIGTSPKFTDTDTKVTSAANHYAPTADASSEITASISGTAGAYSKDTEYTVLTGVKAQRDAKGHVTGITYTAQKIKDTNTTYTVNNGKFSVKGAGTEVASTTANASAASSVDIVAGSNVTVTPDATNNKITIAAKDTTYTSKAAASGGTDVSLVTTGEKYNWNTLTTPKLSIGDYTTSGANYTIFASVSSSSTSRYKDCTVLVSGAGYYYSGDYTGTWLVEMRSSSAGVVKMRATCLAKPSSSTTVTFGYYTDSTAGITYFGLKSTSRRGEFNVTTLVNNSNLFTIAAHTAVKTEPEGWTNATDGGFTDAQMNAVNSGITSTLVGKLNALSSNSQSSISKLFGMDGDGDFENISFSNLASALSGLLCPIQVMNVSDDLNKPLQTNGICLGYWYADAANKPEQYGTHCSISFGGIGIQIAVATKSVSYQNQKVYIRAIYGGTIEAWHQLE